MNTCPCCTHKLLRHYQSGGIYWFCPYCRQTMPNLTGLVQARALSHSSPSLVDRLALQRFLGQSVLPTPSGQLVNW